ncbi:MAG: arylsulfatase, partial [Myxococcales bacterium]
ALQSVDRGVARIMSTLRRHGDLENTYVIFASDNGFVTGHHNRGGKLIPFDRVLRIPMIIRGPGVPQGKRLTTTITNVDLPVSIATVAGAHPTRAVDGVPVFDRLSGPPAYRPVPIAGWRVGNGVRPPLYRGIRYRNFTYFISGRKVEFYDRSTDPGELRNRINDPKFARQVALMKRLYRDYATCSGDSCPKTWS